MNAEKIIFWLGRGVVILLICFMVLLSFDVFSESNTALDIIIGFVMHNIPVFIIILLLMASWKRDTVGGIGFIIIGILFTIFFRTYQRLDTFLVISFPLLLAGCLFLIHKYQIKA